MNDSERPSRNIRLTAMLLAFAAVALGVMMLHICIDVVFRVVLPSTSLHTLMLVSTWYMVIITFLPMPYVAAVHELISVSLIDGFIRDSGKRALKVLVSFLSVAYLALLTYLTLLDAIEKTRKGTVVESVMSYLPIWPPVWALPIAFGSLVLVYLRRIYRDGRR